MNSNNYADQINTLFRHVLRVHKSLLDHQKATLEETEKKNFTAYEMLQMAISHPDFEWLRKISGIMAEMDERTSDKKNPADAKALNDFTHRLYELFNEFSNETDFKTKLNMALSKNSKLSVEVTDFRNALAKTLQM